MILTSRLRENGMTREKSDDCVDLSDSCKSGSTVGNLVINIHVLLNNHCNVVYYAR